MSMPDIVAEIARNLMTVGVKPEKMVIHERGGGQILLGERRSPVPGGVRIESANTWLGFDPGVYVEANFFGEDDTRSFLMRMVSEQFTKIINVPNMKDHGASGVTGCLKNIAYGEFNNVGRSHYKALTDTYSFIGTLAATESLRSRTVLNIMDGLRGVWHAGPFSTDKSTFLPEADEVRDRSRAMDRFLIDVIDDKRKQEGAISVWERDMKLLQPDARGLAGQPEREPFHPRAGTHPRASTLNWRLRRRHDQAHGTHPMTGMMRRSRLLVVGAAALFVAQGAGLALHRRRR